MRKTFKSIGKQRRVALLSSALLLCSTCMIGQNVSIKGKVLDITGEPLLGVNVLVKGTTNGTITDLDGNFMAQRKFPVVPIHIPVVIHTFVI